MTDRIQQALTSARRQIGAIIESKSPLAMTLVEGYTFALGVIEEAIAYHPHHDCDCWTSLQPVLTAWGEVVLGGRDEP